MPEPSAQRVVSRLVEEGLSVAAAESLTGGLLCSALVEVPGASAAVRGGIVAYATAIKHSLLGVDAALLEERGAVDPEVAAQMAIGAARQLGADIGVSTTGVAGPDPQDGQPVGTVYVAVWRRGSAPAQVSGLRLDGDRESIRAQTVAAALELLAAAI